MCELFGFSGNTYKEMNDYLDVFYSHSVRHPHGWGLAILDGKVSRVEKESKQAIRSLYLAERLSEPIYARTCLAHIRYATVGEMKYNNCNPYRWVDRYGRTWTMVHNGTIFNYDALNEYKKVQDGETDSERVLLFIVDAINRKEIELGKELNQQERFELLDTLVCDLSKGNKLNLMIYDGDNFYVHTNEAHTLNQLETPDGRYFATKPLSEEDWYPVPLTQLLAYQDGELIYQGTNHHHEYVFNADQFKSIGGDFIDFANL